MRDNDGRRARAVAPAMAAASVLLAMSAAACGSSSKKSASATATTASDAPATTAAPRTTTTVDAAADTAKAKQINLQASDFPAGWTSSAATANTADDVADEDKMRACLGRPPTGDADTVTDAKSDDFSQNDVSVSSTVSFAKTEDIARQDVAAYNDPKAATCLKDSLGAAIARESQGATVDKLTLTTLPAPTVGDGGFAYRVATTISQSGQRLDLAFDVLAVRVGRAELTLTADASGGTSLPDSLKRDLLSKMVDRAS